MFSECNEIEQMKCENALYPANKYWCRWKTKEGRCINKGEDRDVTENPIQVDICATGLFLLKMLRFLLELSCFSLIIVNKVKKPLLPESRALEIAVCV